MKKREWNQNWLFNYGINSAMAEGFTGSKIEKVIVNLPHDAMISTPRRADAVAGAGTGFFQGINCEYTKVFTWKPEDAERVAFLEFDGIYPGGVILVNGDYVASCRNGYVNHLVRIDNYLVPGQENTVKVVVKNTLQPNGRWYTGAGLYREVSFLIAEKLYIIPDGVRITTLSAEADIAALDISTTICWEGMGNKTCTIITRIYDEKDTIVSEIPVQFGIHSKEETLIRQRVYLETPKLWSPEEPHLYRCESVLLENEKEMDINSCTFGIRRLQLDKKNGLRINGVSVKLKGGCIHHDNGILGAASFKDAEYRRVKMMKDAGYNALRSAHNPMSRKLLEACDSLGMLVMDEFYDAWTHSKADYDCGYFFPEYWEQDIENNVRKDYNHPSVIFYSIGNEIPETGSKIAASWGRRLAEKVRCLDSTRYITNGINMMMSVIDQIGIIMQDIGGNMARDGYSIQEINDLMNDTAAVMEKVVSHPIATEAVAESFDMLDVIGLNYAANVAVEQHEKYPNRIFLGSETLPGALDTNWELIEQNDHILGDFSWTAWDYLGEAGVGRIEEKGDEQITPGLFMGKYPWIAAYTGDFNLIGSRRPVSYWRETLWTGRLHQPYLAVWNPQHIGKEMFRGNWCWTDSVNSWTWPGSENMQTVAEIYADAEEAELILNGISLGRKKVGTDGKKRYCRWDVTYKPGTLEAVTYISGEAVGRTELKTVHDAKIQVESDRNVLGAGTSEIAFVLIEDKDEDNFRDYSSQKTVHIETEGAIHLIASGSADPKTEEAYTDSEHKLYEGQALAVVCAKDMPGKGILKITDDKGGCCNLEFNVI